MHLVYVAFPAVIGGLFLILGAQPVLSGFQQGDSGAVVGGLRTGLLPMGIGVVLLLVAVAISRRTRLGWLLGQAVAVLMALAGLALIVAEIPYLDDGGLGAALAGPFMVIAGLWSLIWAAYGLRLRQGRASFAPGWQPNDRGLGIVTAALVVFVGAAWFSLGAIEGQTAVDVEAEFARAQALVAATTVDITVVDSALDPSTGGGSAVEVERLTLELVISSPEAYVLVAAPTVCLTEIATARDPAYKEDEYCWGGSGPAVALDESFADLAVHAGNRTIRVELTRGDSPCAFGPGSWNAVVAIWPRVAAESSGAGSGPFGVEAQFQVETGGAAPTSGTTGATSDCIASTVSP